MHLSELKGKHFRCSVQPKRISHSSAFKLCTVFSHLHGHCMFQVCATCSFITYLTSLSHMQVWTGYMHLTANRKLSSWGSLKALWDTFPTEQREPLWKVYSFMWNFWRPKHINEIEKTPSPLFQEWIWSEAGCLRGGGKNRQCAARKTEGLGLNGSSSDMNYRTWNVEKEDKWGKPPSSMPTSTINVTIVIENTCWL